MSQSPQLLNPDSVGRTSQIIIGALVMGLICFGGAALLVPVNGKVIDTPMLSLIGAAMTAMQLVLWFVVPGLVARSQMKLFKGLGTEELRSSLAQVYITKTVIAGALLEGAGFFNWVCYIQERQVFTLVVIGVLLALMASSFPSQGQFESWAEEMKRDLN